MKNKHIIENKCKTAISASQITSYGRGIMIGALSPEQELECIRQGKNWQAYEAAGIK